MADDVIRLLRCHGPRPGQVVGHDWGGWIGFLLALRRPERVELVGPWHAAAVATRNLAQPWLCSRRLPTSLGLASPLSVQRVLERYSGYVPSTGAIEAGAQGRPWALGRR